MAIASYTRFAGEECDPTSAIGPFPGHPARKQHGTPAAHFIPSKAAIRGSLSLVYFAMLSQILLAITSLLRW